MFKQCFEDYAGFSVFLAHEDIAPALEWELRIIKYLKEADVVIPLITDNYRDSEFTDQELGMALAWNKIIIPIKLSDINPYGFIKKIQALKCRCDHNEIINAIATVVFVLVNNKEFNSFKSVAIDSVISAFYNSNSYRSTRIIIRILTAIEHFNNKQISRIKDAIKNNNQIYDESFALPNFKKMLKEKYQRAIDI